MLPMPTNTRVHRLDSKALRKWWQDPTCSGRNDCHGNDGIKQLLVTLISIPLLAIFSYYKFGEFRMILPGLLVWAGLLILFLRILRRHRHHVTDRLKVA